MNAGFADAPRLDRGARALESRGRQFVAFDQHASAPQRFWYAGEVDDSGHLSAPGSPRRRRIAACRQRPVRCRDTDALSRKFDDAGDCPRPSVAAVARSFPSTRLDFECVGLAHPVGELQEDLSRCSTITGGQPVSDGRRCICGRQNAAPSGRQEVWSSLQRYLDADDWHVVATIIRVIRLCRVQAVSA